MGDAAPHAKIWQSVTIARGAYGTGGCAEVHPEPALFLVSIEAHDPDCGSGDG